MIASKQTILLSGMIATVPRQGGATWAVLQYILGFRRLGHDIYFVEVIDEAALQPPGMSLVLSDNAAYFHSVMTDFGLEQRSTLLLADTNEAIGLSYTQLRAVAGRADILINISGMLTDPNLLDPIPTRVYLDLDPTFIQLWHAVQGIDIHLDSHTHFMTIGLAIGKDGCSIPTCDRNWISTLQPIVLQYWPISRRIIYDALTTIANWRGYGSIKYRDVLYGQKAHSLRQFFNLPSLTNQRFLLALAIHPDERRDLESLQANSWQIIDPASVAYNPQAYQQFIQTSKAEFGIAKSGYIASRCGWFSDRSACYLASGKPVIAQQTGFSQFIPTGAGLLAFETTEDVLVALELLEGNYAFHSRAARELVEAYFDSDKILTRLLEQVEAI